MQDTVLQALRRNATDEAVAAARQWVAAEPQQAQAHRWLALALRQHGDTTAAQASLEQALALAPDDADLHLQHAGLLLAQRRLDDAGQALQRTTALNPNEFTAYLMQAHLALARDDIDEAERLGRMAARVEPDSPELGAIEGMVALRRGDADRALVVLSAASQRLPHDPRVLYALGLAYMGKNHLAFAEQAFRRTVELNPNSNAAVYGLLVQLALRQGHADRAAEVMRQALSSPQGDTPGMRRLAGELELAANQPLQALEHLRPLLLQLPGDRATLQALLTAWQRLGREQEARAELDAALAAHPLHETWLARLALAPVGGPEAVDVVERWLAAMPGHVPALEARMSLHDMNAETDAAEALAQRIVALEPGRFSGERRLVEALLTRDPAAAIAHVQALLDTAPQTSRPTLLTWLGAVQDRAGDPAAALATWLGLHRELAPSRLPLSPQAEAPPAWPPPGTVAQDNPVWPLFVWGAPGSGIERVVEVMAAVSPVLRSDRFSPTPPNDAFQNYNTLQRLADATLGPQQFVRQWRDALPARGIADGNVIDWLLWWDNDFLRALRPCLPEGRLLLAVRDPRDMLIEWLALGAPAPFALTSTMQAARWLARTLEQVAELREQQLYPHLILRTDDAVNDPAAMAALLEQAFGMRFPTLRRLGPATIEPGHWRKFAQVLADEFALLAPAATRLGYPET